MTTRAIRQKIHELPYVSGGKFQQICETIKSHINELEMMLAVALLATGFILLAVGQIPMGIACIVAGITVMAAAISDWGSLSSQVQNMITTIMSIAGGAFLVIGMILIATGVKMGLGVAMIAVGAALLVTSEKLNWNTMSDKMKSVITEIDIIVKLERIKRSNEYNYISYRCYCIDCTP